MASHQGLRASATVIVSFKGLVNPINSASLTRKSFSNNVVKAENYLKVLTLRRGQNDKVLPGSYVFPGGVVEPSDFNSEWLDLYAANGYGEDTFHKLSSVSHPSPKSPQNGVPPWLGFRICAIRETFEESGILLCRCPGGRSTSSSWASYTILHDIEAWQKRVRADPHQLLALCQSKGCVPDVWGLHLWNNWLTPAHVPKRFNAIFFLAVLPSEPPYSLDMGEMDSLAWSTPEELLEESSEGTVTLMLPQYYEISRLVRFSTAESLAEFAAHRSQYGCPTWTSALCQAQDGIMFVLPGDSAYPEPVDVVDCTVNESVERICSQNGTVHRCVQFKGRNSYHILVHNFQPSHQHVLPVSKMAHPLPSNM